MKNLSKIMPTALALTLALPFSQAAAQDGTNNVRGLMTSGDSGGVQSIITDNYASAEDCMNALRVASFATFRLAGTCSENGNVVRGIQCRSYGERYEELTFPRRP